MRIGAIPDAKMMKTPELPSLDELMKLIIINPGMPLASSRERGREERGERQQERRRKTKSVEGCSSKRKIHSLFLNQDQ